MRCKIFTKKVGVQKEIKNTFFFEKSVQNPYETTTKNLRKLYILMRKKYSMKKSRKKKSTYVHLSAY